MAHTFKHGDAVRCMVGESGKGLVTGNLYTVHHVDVVGDVELAELPEFHWYRDRFEPAGEQPLVPAQAEPVVDEEFTPGMKLKCVYHFPSKAQPVYGGVYTARSFTGLHRKGREIEGTVVLEEFPDTGFWLANFRPVKCTCGENEACSDCPEREPFVSSLPEDADAADHAAEGAHYEWTHEAGSDIPVKLELPKHIAETIRDEIVHGYPDNNPKSRVGVTKSPLHLVPPAAIIGMANALADGAKKYDPYNWRSNKVALSVYIAAAYRHLMALWDGEDVAQDSGVLHIDHALAGLGIVRDAMATGNLIDDRPVKGAASVLFADYTAKVAS